MHYKCINYANVQVAGAKNPGAMKVAPVAVKVVPGSKKAAPVSNSGKEIVSYYIDY